MHPVLQAYQTQLMLNAVFADVYIKQPKDFNPATGVRTGSSPTIITAIPAVEEPGSRMFKAAQGGVPQQIYSLSISFPLLYLGANQLKINDFVAISTMQYPLLKKRYEIRQIETTVNLLVTLRLTEPAGQTPGLTYVIPIGDSISFSETATQTI